MSENTKHDKLCTLLLFSRPLSRATTAAAARITASSEDGLPGRSGCVFVEVHNAFPYKIEIVHNSDMAQCENFRIFLTLIFYVKLILGILEVQNQPFLYICRL